jgi:hypothetical protein
MEVDLGAATGGASHNEASGGSLDTGIEQLL